MGRREQGGSPYGAPTPYGDEGISGIDLPGTADAADDIPGEFPGWEQSGWVRSMRLR